MFESTLSWTLGIVFKIVRVPNNENVRIVSNDCKRVLSILGNNICGYLVLISNNNLATVSRKNQLQLLHITGNSNYYECVSIIAEH